VQHYDVLRLVNIMLCMTTKNIKLVLLVINTIQVGLLKLSKAGLAYSFDLKLGRKLADHKIIRFLSETFDDVNNFSDNVIKTRKICPLETGKNPGIGKN